jgi:hypothetical protein
MIKKTDLRAYPLMTVSRVKSKLPIGYGLDAIRMAHLRYHLWIQVEKRELNLKYSLMDKALLTFLTAAEK